MNKANTQKGLSLIELMISIAVLSIILFIGVPSFQGTLESSRARVITNDLAGALQLARSEALKRRADVTVCISNQAQNGCDNSGDWNDGWLIVTSGSNPIVRVWGGISNVANGNGITSASSQITFTRTGFSKNSSTHQINIDITNHERCIAINPIGQVTVTLGVCT